MANLQNPVKAIHAYCLGCICGNINEVRECPVTYCELYPFRMGKNPFRTKVELSDEEKERRAKLLADSRERVKRENGTETH